MPRHAMDDEMNKVLRLKRQETANEVLPAS